MDGFPEPLSELRRQKLPLPELTSLSGPWPLFSIPRLEDKPQNLIISTLEYTSVSAPLPEIVTLIPEAFVKNYDTRGEERKEGSKDVWLTVKGAKSSRDNRLVSWDTLRSTCDGSKLRSPFVSEQPPDVAVAARIPSRLDSGSKRSPLSISAIELREVLTSTLVGCCSMLHVWNPLEQRFDQTRDSNDKLPVCIDGIDDLTCQSYISRFAEFGTLFRRLEILIVEMRKSAHGDNSVSFAFAHCLSSALVWIRREIGHVVSGMDDTVCGVWVSLQEVQSALSALASLCSRDIGLTPVLYKPLPRTPQQLLSHIYDFLTLQLDRQAPRLVRAILSYTLTITSLPFFAELARSIGLVGLEDMLADARRKAGKTRDKSILDDHEDNEEEIDSELELENDLKEEFPSFMSEEVKDAIVRARRSIRILSSPEFEGGQKIGIPEFRKLEWIWTEDEVLSRIHMHDGKFERGQTEVCETTFNRFPVAPIHRYKPELAGLAVYDLDPGSTSHESDFGIADFIGSYPTHPPALVPTLPLLAELTLSPIKAQADAVGRAALQHFLTPGTSLHLRAHLVLLRAYVLLAAPSFKARLTASLFSDADEDEDEMDEHALENPMGITVRTRARNANWQEVRRKRVRSAISRERSNRPWPIGLSFGLTKQAEWPPGGSDLSFYLRRVIMDSLENVRESENMYNDASYKDELGNDEFWDEAESRLGFAIRDLPVGTGSEKWLDPTLIEALDFLYMQYRPPDPLRCLITEDILSKYQRIFAFLLRLLRVETAMRTVFRLTRPCSVGRVFVDYPDVQSLVLHFRFAAQAFVSALSAYVADTAIRGNIDPFIARVRYAEVAAASRSDEFIGPFVDVYALMQRHSRVLDSILAACLLRGAQRAVGDILRALLEVVLEFTVLVGNAYRSAGSDTRNVIFDEERAAHRLQALYAKFCKTRYALIKALRKISERGAKPFARENLGHSGEKLPAASGGMEALVDILLRIGDTNDQKK